MQRVSNDRDSSSDDERSFPTFNISLPGLQLRAIGKKLEVTQIMMTEATAAYLQVEAALRKSKIAVA